MKFKQEIRVVNNMMIEQDTLELETIGTLKHGQFRFDEQGKIGYFIGEVMEHHDDSQRVLIRILDVWWESDYSNPLPSKETLKSYWDSYYHTK